MFRVQYKSHNAYQSWVNLGSYGDERSALANATRVCGRYFMVRVLNPDGMVIWTC